MIAGRAEPVWDILDPLDQFLQREILWTAKLDEFLLHFRHFCYDLRNFLGNRDGNRKNAVQIPVEQVPRSDSQSTNLHGLAELNDVSVSVRNGYASSKDLKTSGLNLRQVTYSSVSDVRTTVESPTDACVNSPEQGSDARLIVDILRDNKSRWRNREHVRPPFRPVVIASPTNWRRWGADPRRYGMANCGRKIGKHASYRAIYEALIAGSNLKLLYGVWHGARTQLPQLVEDFRGRGGQRRTHISRGLTWPWFAKRSTWTSPARKRERIEKVRIRAAWRVLEQWCNIFQAAAGSTALHVVCVPRNHFTSSSRRTPYREHGILGIQKAVDTQCEPRKLPNPACDFCRRIQHLLL